MPELRLRRERRSGAPRRGRRRRPPTRSTSPAMEEVHTPDLPGIAGVAEFLQVDAGDAVEVRSRSTSTASSGSRSCPATVRSTSSRCAGALAAEDGAALRRRRLRRAPRARRRATSVRTSRARASSSPTRRVRAGAAWVTGANRVDHHVRNAVLGRDFDVDVWADIVSVAPGDPCPRCGNPLSIDRGIEVGHVFQLGTKYSEALDARYTDEKGEQHPMVMGCYGIGVSRVARRGRRGVPRRARPRVAGRARAVRRAPHRRCRAGATPRPRVDRRSRTRLRRAARRRGSTCSTTTAT